ncbi:MAG: tRNA-dihydrouridine synthase, partial [Anaerolineae bacterium]|nr:tRNA-dihydrouridine synthase [Anaerolineae bacterium]
GKDIEQVTLAEKARLIYRHLNLMLDFYGEERGLVLFRKHVVKYVRGLKHSAAVKAKLVICTTPEEFIDLMNEYEAEMSQREGTPAPALIPVDQSSPVPAF